MLTYARGNFQAGAHLPGHLHHAGHCLFGHQRWVRCAAARLSGPAEATRPADFQGAARHPRPLDPCDARICSQEMSGVPDQGCCMSEQARSLPQRSERESRCVPLGRFTDFSVLGPVEARQGESILPLGGAKQITVLAALLIEHEEVVSDRRLIHLLWDDNPPRTVAAQLYTYVSRLRRRLSGAVDFYRVGSGYRMAFRNAFLDYDKFRQLSELGISELNTAEYRSAADHLAEALRLWHGPALSNATETFSEEQSASLEQGRMTALESRIEADLVLGRHTQILPELQTLSVQYPMHEMFRDQLMRALCRSGRKSDAIRVYNEGRRLLMEELGVDPDVKLQQTLRAIITGDERLLSPGS